MATKLFLRNTTTNGITDTGDSIVYDMLTTAGAAVDTNQVTLTNGGTEIQWTQSAGGSTIAWISGRVPAGGFTLTTTDISVWLLESNMNDEAEGRYRVFKYTPGTPTITELGGGPFDDGAELGTTITEMTWAGDVTDTAFAENDRILLRLYATNFTTMTAGTANLQFNAADGSTGDSFFNIAETVAFKSEESTGTGALASGAAAADGTGVSGSTGTGALSAQAADVTGAGQAAWVGTGALAAQAASADGAGVSGSTGTGAIASQAATAEGDGVSGSTGTGALASQAASASGTGTSSSTGPGILLAGDATLAGEGTVTAAVEAEQSFFGAFGGRVKQDRSHREDLEKAIRYLEGDSETKEAVKEIIAPYVAPRRTRRIPIRINWQAFQGDLAAVHQLLALYEQQLAADYARRMDEEDAEVLLLL